MATTTSSPAADAGAHASMGTLGTQLYGERARTASGQSSDRPNRVTTTTTARTPHEIAVAAHGTRPVTASATPRRTQTAGRYAKAAPSSRPTSAPSPDVRA